MEDVGITNGDKGILDQRSVILMVDVDTYIINTCCHELIVHCIKFLATYPVGLREVVPCLVCDNTRVSPRSLC